MLQYLSLNARYSSLCPWRRFPYSKRLLFSSKMLWPTKISLKSSINRKNVKSEIFAVNQIVYSLCEQTGSKKKLFSSSFIPRAFSDPVYTMRVWDEYGTKQYLFGFASTLCWHSFWYEYGTTWMRYAKRPHLKTA